MSEMDGEEHHDGDGNTASARRSEMQLPSTSDGRRIKEGLSRRLRHPGAVWNNAPARVDVQTQRHVALYPTPIDRRRIPKRQGGVHDLWQFVGSAATP